MILISAIPNTANDLDLIVLIAGEGIMYIREIMRNMKPRNNEYGIK